MMWIEWVIRCTRRVRAWYFTARVRRRATRCGPGLRVNGRSQVTGNTTLGRNVNFNGLEITGSGRVTIGDNFHSGPGCLLIAAIHNFDMSLYYERWLRDVLGATSAPDWGGDQVAVAWRLYWYYGDRRAWRG